MPRRRRPGRVSQQHTSGVTIAHAGPGDIVFQFGESARVFQHSLLAAVGITPAVAIQNTLPRDVVNLIGRDRELDRIRAGLEEVDHFGRPIIYVITGMPGIGKTALAVHAAHLLASRFPDGQLFVPLHAHSRRRLPADPRDALGALLRQTGLEVGQLPDDVDERAALWRDWLGGKRLLFVLDDAASHYQVNPLIPAAEGCVVLVTSRRTLTGLDGAIAVPLNTLSPSDAADLFDQASGHPGADPGTVTQLMRLVDHLPLAIELLAARHAYDSVSTVAGLVDELAGAVNRSAAIGAEDEPISATFDLSYNHLSDDMQQTFRLLGLHPGADFDAFATAALTGIALDKARTRLRILASIHLISGQTAGRFRFHDLIGDYAHALADDSAERPAAVTRLLDYYLYAANIAGAHFSRHASSSTQASNNTPSSMPALSNREQAAAWLHAEVGNLRDTVSYCALQRHFRYAVKIASAIYDFLCSQGYWNDALILSDTALAAARQANDLMGQADSLTNLGDIQYRRDQYEAAMASQSEALAIYRDLGDNPGEAKALTRLGDVQYMTMDYRAATFSQEQALLLFRALHDRSGCADALTSLGLVQNVAADYPAAADSLREALRMYRDIGDRDGEAGALTHLGMVQERTGNYLEAIANHSASLEIYRTLGNQLGIANALTYLGLARGSIRDHAAAIANHNEAREIYRNIGDLHGEANSLTYASVVQVKEGNYPAATEGFAKALELYDFLSDRLGRAGALTSTGVLQQQTGDFTSAHRSHTEAIAIYRDLGDKGGQAEVLNNIGDLMNLSTNAAACDQYEQALALAREVGLQLEQARALAGMGRCLISRGRDQDGVEYLRDALTLYQSLGLPESEFLNSTLRNI